MHSSAGVPVPPSWRNPDSGRYGTVVPGPAYQQAGCNRRSFTHTIYIDGQPQTARGTGSPNSGQTGRRSASPNLIKAIKRKPLPLSY